MIKTIVIGNLTKDVELKLDDDPTRQPGFLIKATDVQFLSPRKAEEISAAIDAAAEDDSADGDSGDLAEAA